MKKFFSASLYVTLAILGVNTAASLADDTTVITETISPQSEMHLKLDLMIPKLLGRKEHTIIFNTPGGYVDSEQRMEETMKNSGLHITTKITDMAASAGAILFMKGDVRIMTKDAAILFHGGTNTGTNANMPALLLAKKFIDEGKLESIVAGTYSPNSLLDLKAMETIQAYVAVDGLNKLEANIQTDIFFLTRVNERCVKQVYATLQAINPNVTYEYVLNNLFDNYNSNVILDSKTAKDIGIATEVIDE